MKLLARLCLLLAMLIVVSEGNSQSFRQDYKQWKSQYKKNFRVDPSSPLGRVGTWRLRFFKPKEAMRVLADLEFIEGNEVISFPTTTGKTMEYIPYAKAKFVIYSQQCTLIIYKSAKSVSQKEYENYLFIPFRDYTCGDDSYGGGRYLDLRVSDVKNNKVIIDFNRAYNPYCAYNEAYSCPIPPAENSLPLEIRAGERNYKKRTKAVR